MLGGDAFKVADGTLANTGHWVITKTPTPGMDRLVLFRMEEGVSAESPTIGRPRVLEESTLGQARYHTAGQPYLVEFSTRSKYRTRICQSPLERCCGHGDAGKNSWRWYTTFSISFVLKGLGPVELTSRR